MGTEGKELNEGVKLLCGEIIEGLFPTYSPFKDLCTDFYGSTWVSDRSIFYNQPLVKVSLKVSPKR